MISEKKYTLPPGTQVRQEDFGLLFYTMKGPRLYFLPLKKWIKPSFFKGQHSLTQWMEKKGNLGKISALNLEKIKTSLEQLCRKGVIRECSNSSQWS